MTADLRVPAPLLEPQAWPKGDHLILSIAALGWGGPIGDRIKSAVSIRFETPSGFWSEPKFTVLRDAFLSFESHEAKKVVSLETEPSQKREWAMTLFPKTHQLVDELTFYRLLDLYENSFAPDFVSLETFSLFPGFLRREKSLPPNIWITAAEELAKALALFSPQTDTPGTGHFVIANPTMEIPFSEHAVGLRAYARVRGRLIDRELHWQEAAVFDELRENGKMLVESLITELEAKKFALHKSYSFKTVIEDLTVAGLLLNRN